jgi:hypothetical protein
MVCGFGNKDNPYLCFNIKYCLNRKHYFLIFLLFNCFFGFVYYKYAQNQSQIPQNGIHTNLYRKQNSIQINDPMKFIRNTLENEYNQDDLVAFYKNVEKEFSLGLRCTRKIDQLETTTIPTNSNLTTMHQISSNITAIRYLNLKFFKIFLIIYKVIESVLQIYVKEIFICILISYKIELSRLLLGTTSSQINRSHISRVRHSQRSTLYSFIINNSDACTNEPVDLAIIIISKSNNYKTRDAIRRTWGSGKYLSNYSSIYIKFFFLIDLDENLRDSIRIENDLFHDIIQVELPQQYTLVTHRILSLFEWSFRYCRMAKFIFKTDDDVFINLILLLKFISPLINKSTDNSFRISDMNIYGYIWRNLGVPRKMPSGTVQVRYVVTVDEFPCKSYPDFLSGFGYLIPKKARDALIYAAYQDPDGPFRISDVYFT